MVKKRRITGKRAALVAALGFLAAVGLAFPARATPVLKCEGRDRGACVREARAGYGRLLRDRYRPLALAHFLPVFLLLAAANRDWCALVRRPAAVPPADRATNRDRGGAGAGLGGGGEGGAREALEYRWPTAADPYPDPNPIIPPDSGRPEVSTVPGNAPKGESATTISTRNRTVP